MSDDDALRAAFRDVPLKTKRVKTKRANTDRAPNARRQRRADRTRAQALSPLRILIQLLLVPLVTLSLTVSIYVRTSPYERPDALRHLAAMAGCDTAKAMNLAPAFAGGIGYHERNDPDGDGIACPTQAYLLSLAVQNQRAALQQTVPSHPALAPNRRASSGAKFIKP